MALEAFTPSQPLTLGVELELQLLDTHDFDLTPRARGPAARAESATSGAWDVKPEITRSMIEISTSMQRAFTPLRDELRDLRGQMSRAARKLNIAHLRRRHARLPALERAAHLPDRALPLHQRAVRLPGQAVHRVRPARARGRCQRRRRAVAAACAVALRAALHRTGGLVALRAGRRHGLPLGAAEFGVRVPAVGPRAVRAHLGRLRPVLRQDDQHRRRAVDEGLLLGHPAQARVRHHRAARLRHAAAAWTRRRRWRVICSACAATCAKSGRSSRPRTTTSSTPSTASRPAASASTARSSTPRPSSAASCATTSSARWRASTQHALDLQALDASNLIRDSLFDGNDATLAARPAAQAPADVGRGGGRGRALDD